MRRVVAVREAALDRAELADHVAQHREHVRHIAAAHPAMHERLQRGAVALHIELPYERGWRRPHHGHHGLDRRLHGRHAAKRQARGDERHDFAIGHVGIASHDLDRIERGVGPVEAVVEGVERGLHRVSI